MGLNDVVESTSLRSLVDSDDDDDDGGARDAFSLRLRMEKITTREGRGDAQIDSQMVESALPSMRPVISLQFTYMERPVDVVEPNTDEEEEDEDEDSDFDIVPAIEESIAALLSSNVSEEGDYDHDCEACPICLEEFESAMGTHGKSQFLTRMPCAHVFHCHCIVQWLHIRHLCPLCRYPMPTRVIMKERLIPHFHRAGLSKLSQV